LSESRQSVRDWFSDLGSEEIFIAFVDAVIHIDNTQKELWKLAKVEKDSLKKTKILSSISENAIRKTNLLKTEESFLTEFYFKQEDLSSRYKAKQEFLDSMRYGM